MTEIQRTTLTAFLHENGWSNQDAWQHPGVPGQFNIEGALLRLGRQLGPAAEVPIVQDETGYLVGLMSDAGEVELAEHFDNVDAGEMYAKWLSASFGVPWSHAE